MDSSVASSTPQASTPQAALPLERAAAEVIAQSLRALADPTRVQIIGLILEAQGGRRSVTDIATALGLSQPTVSHHLRILSDEGVLDRQQDGRLAWYSVAPSRVADVFESLRTDPVVATVAPPVLERIAHDLTPRFAGVFSRETIAEYVHASYALLAERARITRYLPSLTARFATDRLLALARSTGVAVDSVPDVLFVCVQNSGRSQLAAAILRSLAGDRVRVLTAGSAPAGSISPVVLAALDEIGISAAAEFPKPLTDEVVRGADYVITMGCGDACPVYPGRRYLDWELPDPAGMPLDGVRAVRDDIEARVRGLLAELNIR